MNIIVGIGRSGGGNRVMSITRAFAACAAIIAITGCRSADPSPSSTAPGTSSVAALDQPAVAGSNTSTKDVDLHESLTCEATQEVVLHVEGLTCEGCAWQIRETLQKVDGITDIKTTVADKRVVVTFDPHRATIATAMHALDHVGYKSEEVRQ